MPLHPPFITVVSGGSYDGPVDNRRYAGSYAGRISSPLVIDDRWRMMVDSPYVVWPANSIML